MSEKMSEKMVCKFCGKQACLSCLWEGDLELVAESEYLSRDKLFKTPVRVATEAGDDEANHRPS